MNDQKVLELLKDGKRTAAFQKLYEGYPQAEKLILSKGGTKQDAKDVYQDAIMIFYQKAKQEKFELSSRISTYLYSVVRFLWKDILIKRNRYLGSMDEEEIHSIAAEEIGEAIEKEQQFKKLDAVLEKLGDRCLQLLKLFYYRRFSMEKIAKQMSFSSAKVARNQKYKCIERAKEKLKTIHLAGNLKNEA